MEKIILIVPLIEFISSTDKCVCIVLQCKVEMQVKIRKLTYFLTKSDKFIFL
jgi:hypothetical protein